MKKLILSGAIAVLLAGCATVKPSVQPSIQPPVQHHAVKAKPPTVAPPVGVAPPVAPKTFKQRWLSKFFRDRAK
jgi:hypothetical protein